MSEIKRHNSEINLKQYLSIDSWDVARPATYIMNVSSLTLFYYIKFAHMHHKHIKLQYFNETS